MRCAVFFVISQFATVSAAQTTPFVVPLYLQEKPGASESYRYTSPALGERAAQLVALHPEQIRLENWSVEWSILRTDGSVDNLQTDTDTAPNSTHGEGQTPAEPAQENSENRLGGSLALPADPGGHSSQINAADVIQRLDREDRFQATLRYRGPLQLTPEQQQAVVPRLLLLPTTSITGSTATPQRPNTNPPANVLIVLIDTLRQDHTSAYGHPYALTPHLDLLRCAGARFDEAYATSSSTRPSCGSLMTGFYPLAHGSIRSCTLPFPIHPGAPRLAESFRARDFRTGGFYANGQVGPGSGFGVGFETYEGPIADEELTGRALQWIDSLGQNSRWFLYAHYIAPHHPYEPPVPYDSIFTGQTGDGEHDRYLGEIAVEDRRVGELLEGVAKRGLWNDTLVWVVTDHGEEFWEHGWKWHGASLYEEVTRMVSLVSYPPAIAPGRTVTEPHSILDLPATLHQFFDTTDPPADQGKSMAGHLRGDPAPASATRTLYLQLYAGVEDRPHRGDRQAVLRDGEKFIWKTTLNQFERYDLRNDAAEKMNLWSDKSTPAGEIEAELKRFQQSCAEIARTFQENANADIPAMSAEDIESIQALGYGGIPLE